MIHIVLKLNSSTYVIKNFELSFIGEALFLLFFVATYLYIFFSPIFIILIFFNTINFKTTLSNLIDPVFHITIFIVLQCLSYITSIKSTRLHQ
ncbi:hypothetical protein AXE89_02085 [Staphylococcus aureus]|nr:hypothetical protein [Staphylococcus aureus]